MRTTLTLFLAAGVALAVVLVSTQEYDPKEWVEVPYPNYTMHWVNISTVPMGRVLPPVIFYLFTKENANDLQIIWDADDLKESHFNPENPTRFLIHGWRQGNSYKKSMLIKIRDKYMSVGSFNIFIVFWTAGNYRNYIWAARNTLLAGRKTAAFIEVLITEGKLKANDTYIVGFGLGAHVAGITGKHVKLQKINTIIGLDPAKHLFTDADPSERLTKEDALYVETIHTDAGYLGLEGPIGHASFYPNYGSHQPGCSNQPGWSFSDFVDCSHLRAYDYFAASITNPDNFKAIQCTSYSDIAEQNCHPTEITLHMGGEPSNYGHSYQGVYYLKTNADKK